MEPQLSKEQGDKPAASNSGADTDLAGKTFQDLSRSRAALTAFTERYGSRDIVSYEEVDGNPEVGTVEVLKQLHYVEKLSMGSLRTIGEYQAELLKILLNEKPIHVFSEGVADDVESSKAFLVDISPVDNAAKEIISNGNLPEQLNDTQLRALALKGAAWFYNQIEESAVIHVTASDKEEKEWKAELAKKPEERDAIVMAHRERLAMSHVMEFLDKNPGEKVYLIYGAAHSWGPEDFPIDQNSPDRRPQMNARVIPGLRDKDIISEKLATDLAKHPDLEARIYEASNYVSPSVLPLIGTEANFKIALGKSGLRTKLDYPLSITMNKLRDQPERQAMLLDEVTILSPYAFTKLATNELQRQALDSVSVQGDVNDYFLGAAKIEDPHVELVLLGTARRLGADTAGYANSEEAKQLVQIKSSSLSDTKEVVDSLGIEVDWAREAIDRAVSLSPSVLRELPNAELQQKALSKVVYRNAKEREVYGKLFIEKYAKNEKIAALATEKHQAPDETNTARMSEHEKTIETLLALAHDPQLQDHFVNQLERVPAMGLLAITSPEAKIAALEKLAPINETTREAVNLGFFFSQEHQNPDVIVALAKRFKPSALEAEDALAYTSESPNQQREILERCDTIPFRAIGYLATKELQASALTKLAPPERAIEYDALLKELPPEISNRLRASFPRPKE